MTTESMRERFEAHMLRLNACTRLARQNESVGGEYRTISVERAWQQWQAATLAERERAAKVCEKLRDDHCKATQDVPYKADRCHPDDPSCEYVDAWGMAAEAIRKGK